MITVKIPLQALFTDPVLIDTAQKALLVSNIEKWTDGQYVYWENINAYNPATYMLLTNEVLTAVVNSGGELEGVPLWFHVPAINVNDVVPDVLPNASFVDDQGNTIQRTWTQWHDATHEIVTLPDGSILVPTNAWGSELPASIVLNASTVSGVPFVNTVEYKNLLPQENITP